MACLRPLFPDQLSRSLSSLADINRDEDIVLFVEANDEYTYVKHHKQKLVLLISAMRHFADELEREGIRIGYVALDAPDNTGAVCSEIARAVERLGCDRVVLTEPSEYRQHVLVSALEKNLPVPLEQRSDDRFLCSRDEFSDWAAGRKNLTMEYFYREMRTRTGYLMEGDEPAGGRWNFDTENRKRLPGGFAVPKRPEREPDAITTDVIRLVEARFGDHFGELDEASFRWHVTRKGALEALSFFVDTSLSNFGAYQDAMKATDDDDHSDGDVVSRRSAEMLFHSLVSPYLNIGLLDPREVCEAAAAAYEEGRAPLAAVEGFIRQLIGWREFVRGLYWLEMPDYAQSNFLGATRPLPSFYWTGETDMRCLRQTVAGTRRNAYAHHIQRLMVTGNFALLAGIDPREVEEWYLIVYADAFDWVELPNTHGMALFADGGVMATKPYAASANYINKMSDYCGRCRFNPKEKQGPEACPFNYLYWNFFIENREQLEDNHRLRMTFRTLDRMNSSRRAQIISDAARFLDGL